MLSAWVRNIQDLENDVPHRTAGKCSFIGVCKWSVLSLSSLRLGPTHRGGLDIKNTNLQIKKTYKTCFFHFYKKHLKACIKTLNYSIHSSKKHRQYESNKVNNTATKHSLCPGNEVFCLCPWEMHHICNFVRFCFNNNKNTTFKNAQKHKNIKKTLKNFFYTSMVRHFLVL